LFRRSADEVLWIQHFVYLIFDGVEELGGFYPGDKVVGLALCEVQNQLSFNREEGLEINRFIWPKFQDIPRRGTMTESAVMRKGATPKMTYLLLDDIAGLVGENSDFFMGLLAVSAFGYELHDDVFSGHEGELCHKATADDCGVDDEAGYDYSRESA
jgi:hypothetical protein